MRRLAFNVLQTVFMGLTSKKRNHISNMESTTVQLLIKIIDRVSNQKVVVQTLIREQNINRALIMEGLIQTNLHMQIGVVDEKY